MDKFWLVWNEKTGYTARKHNTYESASNEAKRLALKNKEIKFFILEAKEYKVVNEVTSIILYEPNDIF